ncbi:MAG: hypothetical protein AAGA69_12455, partial [Pseudomonadota bacterium]
MGRTARRMGQSPGWQEAVLWLCVALVSACSSSGVLDEDRYDGVDTIITNVTIIDLEIGTFAPDQMILIGNGEIRGVEGSSRRLPADLTIIDGEGRFVMPALWDSHAHVLQEPEDAVDDILSRYLG